MCEGSKAQSTLNLPLLPLPLPPLPLHPQPRLSHRPHRHLHREERPGTNRHRPHQRRPHPFPKCPHPPLPPNLRKRMPHIPIPPLIPRQLIRLHPALDYIQRITRQPQRLSREPAVQRDLPAGHIRPGSVPRHQVLEGEEPDPVGLGFAEQGDRRAAVEAVCDSGGAGEGLDAGEGAGVQAVRAVRLGLQTDAHVLDGGGEEGVGDAGGRAGEVVLGVG